MGSKRGQRRAPALAHPATRQIMTYQPGRKIGYKAGTAAALCGLLLAGGAYSSADSLTAPSTADTAPLASGVASGKTVSIRLSRADIYTVVNQFQQQTGLNVAILEGAQPYRRINVFLDHATPQQALRYIAASAGGTVTLQSDGVYLIQSADAATDQSANGLAPNGDLAPGDAGSPASAPPASYAQPSAPAPQASEPVTIHKITLHYISPADVMDKMGWTADVHPGPAPQIETTPPPPTTPQGPNVSVITTPPMFNNYSPNTQPPSVPAGQGTTGNGQANDITNPGNTSEQANQFGFPGGGGFGGGFPGGGGFNGGGGFGGNRGGFGGNRGGFGNNGFGGQNGQQQNVLPDGVDHIYGIEGDNSLLVFATQQGYETVRQIVNYLDVQARQVEIKVEFVTATVNAVDQFGINFSLIPSPTSAINVPLANQNPGGGGTSGVANLGSTYLQFAYGNVAAQLYDLITKTNSKVVSAPIISTTNNVQATIVFQTQIPFNTPTTTIVPNGGTVTNNVTTFESLVTQLQVLPRINGDDTVTLQLFPTISTPVSGGNTSNGATAYNTEFLSATRTVRSGETMVLGGLVSKTESSSTSRVPFFSDLPLIGGLFKTHAVDNTDQELLIFVTPTIIDEGDSDSGDTASPQNDVSVNAVPGAEPNAGGAVTP